MSKTTIAMRLYRTASTQQRIATTWHSSKRGLASDTTNSAGEGAAQCIPKSEPMVEEIELGTDDSAATARRAKLLKRYGDIAATEPVAVPMAAAAAKDAEDKADDDAKHNEIWGDYVQYMEHQRKKGWKT